MDVELTKKDGTVIKLSEYGFIVNDIVIDSMQINTKYQDKENMNGRILMGSNYISRDIVVPCFCKVKNRSDIAYMRDMLYSLTTDIEPMYLREIRRKEELNYRFTQPTSDDYVKLDKNNFPDYEYSRHDQQIYVNGKQYKVIFNGVINPKQKGNKVSFELKFETTELPYGESIGTSLELEENKKVGLWSFDFNIDWHAGGDKRKYTFENLSKGTVYYHGSAPNDQFNMYKKITIILGEDTESFVWNLTHAEIMKIEGIKLKAGDKIVYDSFRVYKNGVEISTETNIAQPKFKYGANKFEFNQTVQKVQFDLKFYYK
ncbi:TPA: phage tail family protein [Staphylococcus aureus]|nr:phage tail family protein [Staphylococcus aureus]